MSGAPLIYSNLINLVIYYHSVIENGDKLQVMIFAEI